MPAGGGFRGGGSSGGGGGGGAGAGTRAGGDGDLPMYENNEIVNGGGAGGGGGGGGGGGHMYENTRPGAKAPPAARPMKSASGTDFYGPGPAGRRDGGPTRKSSEVRGVGGITRDANRMTIASREESRGSVAYIGSVKSQWFMPHLSRMETVDFLKGKRHGSFVIRKSSFRPELEPGASGVSDSNATYYAISMKKRDRELWNGLIIHSIGIFTMVCEDAKEFKYNDLSELVKGLLSNQDLISVAGLPERLLLPSTGKP